MLNLKKFITLIVPSSILGLSWFWWRWKRRAICSSNKIDSHVESQDILSVDLVDNLNDKSIRVKFHQQNDLDANVDLLNKDLCIDATVVMEKPISEDLLVSDDSICIDEPVHPVFHNEINEIIEEEIDILAVNPAECENSESECFTNERSHSVISQLSIECVQEDVVCDDFSPVNYRGSVGKRIRSQSSCGDSAICEDYSSSDALSNSGSDSAVKLSEGEVCSSDCKPAEEQGNKSGCYPKEGGRNYRDWYGPSIGSDDFIERTEKTRHWGSLPVSDTDSDSECILKRTAKIGSVSLDKLSIELNEELTKIKSIDDRRDTMRYSTRHQKQGRRRNRKSESRNAKKQSNSKPSPQPKKSESRRSKKKNSCSSPKKDMDKPWRNQDSGRRCDMLSSDTDDKRVTIEYEFPDDMCGRLIGKSGRHISEFKESNGVDICIECELHGKNRIVSITGVLAQVKKAEKILNEKFKDSLKLIDFPDIVEAERNISTISLPENTEFNVVVTAIVDVGNFYIQLCNSEVEERLTQLQTEIFGCYVAPRQKYLYLGKDIPKVDEYCVSLVDNVWCRLRILEVYPEDRMVDAFFIDYGGNVHLSIDTIWRIRPDLLQIPAQATLCHLSNAVPVVDNAEFSYEANDLFYQLVGAKALQAFVTSIKDEIPSVQLSYFNEDRGEMFSVLEQMQLWGLVQDETIPLCDGSSVSSISPNGNYSLDDCIKNNLIHEEYPEDSQLVESILNCSAPQFICAS